MSKKNSEQICGVLFAPESYWTPPKDFPNLEGVPHLGIDVETRDPGISAGNGPGFIRGEGQCIGFSLSTKDQSWYFPLGHRWNDNLDYESTLRFLNSVVLDQKKTLYGANLLYELEVLDFLGIEVKSKLIDVQVIEALLDEEADDYSLEAISLKRIGDRKNEELLRDAAICYGVDPKKEMWKLPAKYVGPYAEWDAKAPLLIYDVQKGKIAEEQLETVVDLEMRLIPLIWKMRKKGVPIDLSAANKLKGEWIATQNDLIADLHRDWGVLLSTGYEVEAIRQVCDIEEIRYPITPKTKAPSITKAFIESCEHPFLKKIQALREMDRLRGTFVDKLFFQNSYNGRIHCQFKSTMREDGGTRSGRFASSNPNLQQVPSKSDLAPLIRACFVPEPGKRWGKWDYSQQEPRIMLHFAAAVGCRGAKEAIEFMRNNPSKKFYDLAQKAANISYRDAKDVTLGRMYGMGKRKMAYKLAKTIEECEKVLEDFDNGNPFVIEISNRMKAAADKRGYIRTFLGRRSRFDLWAPSTWRDKARDGAYADGLPAYVRGYEAALEVYREKYPRTKLVRQMTHKALNRSVQGTGADMIKVGMLNMYEEDGYVPYLQVHDELDGPIENEEEGLYRKKKLEEALNLLCPVKSDFKLLDHWV